jgi:hypothetical protein
VEKVSEGVAIFSVAKPYSKAKGSLSSSENTKNKQTNKMSFEEKSSIDDFQSEQRWQVWRN